MDSIRIYGANQHNLRNVDVTIPRNSLTVVTGLSGSGKSSLAFDTEELESLKQVDKKAEIKSVDWEAEAAARRAEMLAHMR